MVGELGSRQRRRLRVTENLAEVLAVVDVLEVERLAGQVRDAGLVGEDVAGWGMDTYLLPRLASGMYSAREISAAEALNAWTRIAAL